MTVKWTVDDLATSDHRQFLPAGEYQIEVAREGNASYKLVFDNRVPNSPQWKARWSADGSPGNWTPLAGAAALGAPASAVEFGQAKAMAVEWGKRELAKRPHLRQPGPVSQWKRNGDGGE